MSERDRPEPSLREDEVREPPVAHIEEAPVAESRKRTGEKPHEMADRVRVMRDEPASERQGMLATTLSTAASTRSRVVTAGTKWSVMSLSLRSTSMAVTP